MSAAQHLTPIGLRELQIYQKLYKEDWPKYCAQFYCLDNFIRFLQLEPNIRNLKAYTFGKQTNGLYIIVDRYQLFVGCLESCENETLQQALSLLDWTKGLKCSSIPSRHYEPLSRVVKQKKLQLEFDDKTNLYFMPAAEALQLKFHVPEQYFLKDLSEADAKVVDDNWPNRHIGSLYFVKRQIKMCANVGLYEKDTQNLVAWCIRLQGGYLGALQVKNTHLRQGLGSLVTQAVSQRIAALGHDVMALVGPNNKPSCGMFDKLGFKVIDQCYWLRTKPIDAQFTWPEDE